jgi:hypothetical protein
MSHSDDETKITDEHRDARNDVIHEYGHLWRQAIEKAGIVDKSVTDQLLQVCAACYLDGVHQGSRLTIQQIVREK